MALEIYGHPFAAFVWKPLIAAYERQIPFVFRMVDQGHPENLAKMGRALADGAVSGARRR